MDENAPMSGTPVYPLFRIHFWKGGCIVNGNGRLAGGISGWFFRKQFCIRLWTKKVGNGDTGVTTSINSR